MQLLVVPLDDASEFGGIPLGDALTDVIVQASAETQKENDTTQGEAVDFLESSPGGGPGTSTPAELPSSTP